VQALMLSLYHRRKRILNLNGVYKKSFTCRVLIGSTDVQYSVYFILNEAVSCEPSPKEGAQKETVPKHLIIRA
jgi:hypothetical protein